MNIDPKQIPREVVKTLLQAFQSGSDWHAAFAAALSAWPGVEKSKYYSGQGRPGVPALSLPLPRKEPQG